MKEKNIEAIIFDSDGTLLDTRELILAAFEHSLSTHGHPVPSRSDIALHGGRTLADCYLILAPKGDNVLLCETHHEFQMQRLDLLAGYEGLHELLVAIKSNGLKIAVCTSRGQHVKELLEQVGVLKFFDAIVTKDDVSKHKPDPEGLLKLADMLGRPISRCVMVGDTNADIEAGKNAHVAYTIGITHGLGTQQSLAEAGAEYIVDHLSKILPIVTNDLG